LTDNPSQVNTAASQSSASPAGQQFGSAGKGQSQAPANGKGASNASANAGSGSGSAGRQRSWQEVMQSSNRLDVPEGLWMRCPSCEAMSYRKQVEQNRHVCPECDYHYRIGADERIEQLCDTASFEPMWEGLAPVDALEFTDRMPYHERLAREQSKTGHNDAIVAGQGFIKGRGVVLACLDFRFIMASMGCVVGEKVTRAAELALETDRPLVIVSAAGGARMQESALSLAQMAKTSAALARLDEAGGLFISVLTDPTTGGVTASFAMLGDLILAEPKALIGFAGPRVIANTVRQELPEGFQKAEFLQEKGFVDRVVHRHDMRSEISRVIDYAGK
jgi:acetyl-CoA carboxylase carboxyl transferase subunit beta